MRALIAFLCLTLLPASSEAFFGCLTDRIRDNARNRFIVDLLGNRIPQIQPYPYQFPIQFPVQPPVQFPVQPGSGQLIGNLPIGGGQFPGFPVQPQTLQWERVVLFQYDQFGRIVPVVRYVLSGR